MIQLVYMLLSIIFFSISLFFIHLLAGFSALFATLLSIAVAFILLFLCGLWLGDRKPVNKNDPPLVVSNKKF